MPRQEEQKFLDLDLVAQQIPNVHDRSLFQEAVNCYYAGSHRAAAILAWYAAANCLKRRIFELRLDGDGEARDVAKDLTPPNEGDSQTGEEVALLNGARKCELIDDFECKSLHYARDMRNKCAHPTGVVPSAEGIRHVLFICSQYVLNRMGYRGLAYIRDVVTVQFDDASFLANESMSEAHCKEIISRVPLRLWSQFIKIAVEERSSHSDIWRRNAWTFFHHLLLSADDAAVVDLAGSMQGFESTAPEFFASLVGLDARTARYWGSQKRAQIRNRLRVSSAVRIQPEDIHSWATICAQDGLEEADIELLRTRFTIFARHIKSESDFLAARRSELVQMVAGLVREDSIPSMAASGCIHLFPSAAFDRIDTSDAEKIDTWKTAISSIIADVVSKFTRDEKYRELIEKVREWNSTLLSQLLESASAYWAECSEDHPEDVLFLFQARDELQNRNPLAVPEEFFRTIRNIWEGTILSEWSTAKSESGRIFRSQVKEADRDAAGIAAEVQPKVEDEIVDFWGERLGVRISPHQDRILSLAASKDLILLAELAEQLNLDPIELRADMDYLVLQGLVRLEDDIFVLRDDIKDLLSQA